MPAQRLTIAQVTPYAWDVEHEVNHAIAKVAERLAARGHRVAIVAPSGSHRAIRETGKLLRAARTNPELVFAGAEVPVLAAGEALANITARRGRAVPVDVSRAIDGLFETVAFDVVHVHDPWAPSLASAALRTSPALNIGSFHAPTERAVTTQVARRLVQLVFGRLDARIASFEATADVMRRHFPADYRVILPGVDPVWHDGHATKTPRIVFVDAEERGALRMFLRALRRLDPELAWEATVVSARGPSSSTPLRSELRERISFVEDGEQQALREAELVVLASDGTAPAPGLALRALAAGAVPLAPTLDCYRELLDDGERGLLFVDGDGQGLAEQLQRLLADDALRKRLHDAAAPLREQLTWDRASAETEAVYRSVVARRHTGKASPELRRRLSKRPLIDVDLHMHTDHSGDCATPVEVLLATAKEHGLGAIAVTDHNEVSGAFDAAEKAARFGVKVIIGEEVKTASQGEVIGLFLTEKIARGMTLQETVAEIKRQGGLVYVPHPFDRMHSVPDYEHLLAVLDDIDAIEVYNPRVAIGSFNEEAERFARKYRIVAGAGSDAHVARGLGSVRIRMRDFDGPEEFLESLREADIITKPGTLLYVQALKFLETKATPAAARVRRRERRVRRASRKA